MKRSFVNGIAAVSLAAALFSGTLSVSAQPRTYNAADYQNSDIYTVFGTTEYLALRTETAYRASNEIGKIVNGQTVEVIDKYTGNSDYWYVYASSLGKYGYVNCNYLRQESGCASVYNTCYYTVTGVDHYLALRTDTVYKAENEIGKIYNGENVELISTDTGNPDYWYVYASTLGEYGYVNCNYLKTKSGYTPVYNTSYFTVNVSEGYLALRTEMAFRTENEIGKLYNGENVELICADTGNWEYWYVYVPAFGKYGYVNCNYLREKNGCTSYYYSGYYTVKVSDGYLALRTETSYKSANEIGRIYNGETVEVVNINTGDSDYWYVYAPTLGKYGYVNCNYLV